MEYETAMKKNYVYIQHGNLIEMMGERRQTQRNTY